MYLCADNHRKNSKEPKQEIKNELESSHIVGANTPQQDTPEIRLPGGKQSTNVTKTEARCNVAHKYTVITVQMKQCKRGFDERLEPNLQAVTRAKTILSPFARAFDNYNFYFRFCFRHRE